MRIRGSLHRRYLDKYLGYELRCYGPGLVCGTVHYPFRNEWKPTQPYLHHRHVLPAPLDVHVCPTRIAVRPRAPGFRLAEGTDVLQRSNWLGKWVP
jgi:hypothetical protein